MSGVSERDQPSHPIGFRDKNSRRNRRQNSAALCGFPSPNHSTIAPIVTTWLAANVTAKTFTNIALPSHSSQKQQKYDHGGPYRAHQRGCDVERRAPLLPGLRTCDPHAPDETLAHHLCKSSHRGPPSLSMGRWPFGRYAIPADK